MRLNNVRLSFPDIWTAVEYQKGDGRPRFNATFLIEPGSENDKLIEAEIIAQAKEVWGDKWQKTLASMKGNSNKYAYLDGDLKEYDGYADHFYLACHSKTRPLIIDRDRSQLTEQDGKVYAGCYVNATVSIYCQKGENAGVRASFSGIQFFQNGDAFSAGRAASEDDFEDLAEGADAEGLV